MNKHEARSKILSHALKLAPFDGWNPLMLKQAAENVGLNEADVIRVFNNDPLEAIRFWIEQTNSKTIAYASTLALSEMKIRERILHLMMHRFEYLKPHRESVRSAVRVLARPWNAPLNLTLLHQTVDTIWKCAGDTSNDYNWYTKRLLLAGVYSSSLIFWLSDESDDLSETRAFVTKRIDQVLKIGGSIGKFVKRAA